MSDIAFKYIQDSEEVSNDLKLILQNERCLEKRTLRNIKLIKVSLWYFDKISLKYFLIIFGYKFVMFEPYLKKYVSFPETSEHHLSKYQKTRFR